MCLGRGYDEGGNISGRKKLLFKPLLKKNKRSDFWSERFALRLVA